jgi:hypothetical protein
VDPLYHQETTQCARLPHYYNYETIENLDMGYKRVMIRVVLGAIDNNDRLVYFATSLDS